MRRWRRPTVRGLTAPCPREGETARWPADG
jgi:hypothetical protein